MALKLIFMGTPEFSVPILKSLYESKHDILKVYTQPPKKQNRGQKINLTAVHQFCINHNLPVRYPERIDSEEEYQEIKKLKPDVAVVVAYGKIIPQKILSIDNIKFLNIHASLLPKWRGAAPIQRAIINLDNETGISIMKIVPKLDCGPVMMQSKIKIFQNTNYKELSDKLSSLGASMILKSLDIVEKKSEIFIEQNETEACYAKKISKSETKVNWNDDAKKVIGKINAFSPTPGSWFEYKKSRLKIIEAIEVKGRGSPGQIINKNFTVACAHNAIKILKLQKEGKKIMSIEDYLKGNQLILDFNLS